MAEVIHEAAHLLRSPLSRQWRSHWAGASLASSGCWAAAGSSWTPCCSQELLHVGWGWRGAVAGQTQSHTLWLMHAVTKHFLFKLMIISQSAAPHPITCKTVNVMLTFHYLTWIDCNRFGNEKQQTEVATTRGKQGENWGKGCFFLVWDHTWGFILCVDIVLLATFFFRHPLQTRGRVWVKQQTQKATDNIH